VSHLTSVPSDPNELRAWLAEHGGARPGARFEAFRNSEIELPPAPEETRLLTVEVTLRDTDLRVWRRLLVPGEATLDQVHDIVQVAMGWTNSHLHRFYAGEGDDAAHFVTAEDLDEGEDGTPEREARLDQLLRAVGDTIRYDYDFGDGWEHQLRLVEVEALEGDVRARCIAGQLACPPEDVGGTHGYEQVAAWVRAGSPPDAVPPSFGSYEHAIDWLPLGWHPDEFDVEETDQLMRGAVARGRLVERLRPAAAGALLRVSPAAAARVSEWIAAGAETSLSVSDLEELTAPYRRLLEVIDGGVELTASGYVRPPVVKALVEALEVDPILAGKSSSENRVRPLHTFRKVVQAVGLVHSQYKLLMPTTAGIQFRGDSQGLWNHVRTRLPIGRTELKKDVGWYSLLALAGGVGSDGVFDAVHELCVDAGWEDDRGEPIARYAVIELVWPMMAALMGARWSSLREWPAWVPAAAASAIFAD